MTVKELKEKNTFFITTYHMKPTINFVKEIRNVLRSANDNIYIYSTTFSSASESPIKNGLSDHVKYYLVINNTAAAHDAIHLKQRIRMNKQVTE
jgi:hypothetical protein